jgi:hypothetical protein
MTSFSLILLTILVVLAWVHAVSVAGEIGPSSGNTVDEPVNPDELVGGRYVGDDLSPAEEAAERILFVTELLEETIELLLDVMEEIQSDSAEPTAGPFTAPSQPPAPVVRATSHTLVSLIGRLRLARLMSRQVHVGPNISGYRASE